jgi:hypothetical protein
MLSLNSLHVHGIVLNAETELLATLRLRDAAKDWGHFRLFGTLAIGHMAHLVLTECGAGHSRFCSITALTERISCWSGRQGLRE